MFWYGLAYLIASVFFILSLNALNSPKSAKKGNIFGIVGMVIAIFTTIALPSVSNYLFIGLALLIGGSIGAYISYKIDMTKLPQLIAAFHSLVGLSAVLVAIATFYNPQIFNIGIRGDIQTKSLIEMALGVSIGAITFSGSLVAFLKLSGLSKSSAIHFKGQQFLNALIALVVVIGMILLCATNSDYYLWGLIIASFVLGYLLIIPIGGADMPVVVSMLNSYSGFAAAGIGFSLSNPALIIVGALVGSSGAILSYIMCKAMNRSIFNVIFGGVAQSEISTEGNPKKQQHYKSGNGEDAAFILKNASKVIIVPGYGMAVAQAQHVVKKMADHLKAEGVKVKYAIHPVAGRMPGHMNVLLAEANIDYEDVFELEQINSEFSSADVAYVMGANDVTNPLAKTDPTSPIYGMPILDVEKAKTILFVKRSMGTGYSGVDNDLFYRNNTMMLLGDAKAITEAIIKAL
ncbi:NAD(P) transhydrogenase subunit beta [Candidatus Hepatincolaceae symbiont of Richtersius coronifer]